LALPRLDQAGIVKYRKRIVALLLLAMLAGAIGWLAGTTGGLRFVAARALPLLPVALNPEEIEGRLLGPIELGRMEITSPGLRGEIAGARLDWRPAALLRGTLHVRELRVSGPRFELEAAGAVPGDAAAAEPGRFSLPLTIMVDHLGVGGGALRFDGEVVADDVDLELSGTASGRELSLRRLALQSRQGQLDGHAHVSLDPAQPWDLDVRWRLALDDADFTGRTRIEGTLDELGVKQEISAPLVAQLEGSVRGLPDAPAWALDLAVQPLPARAAFWPDALDGFAARLRIGGDIEESLVSGSFELPAYLAGSTNVQARGGWAENVAQVRQLELGIPGGGTLSASGWFEPGDAPEAEFMLSGAGLGWPLDGTAREIDLPRLEVRGNGAGARWNIVASARARRDGLPELAIESVLQSAGSLLTIERLEVRSEDDAVIARASGAIETAEDRIEYRVAATADARLPDFPPVAITLKATGDAQGLQVEALAADLLGGSITGAGRIAWEGEQAADFELEFADLDPAAVLPDWPGRLAGSLELSGLPTAASGLEVTLRSLRGELRSLRLSGDASLNLQGDETRLRNLTIAVGDATLRASGRSDGAAISAAASLDVPALQAIDSRAHGTLSAATKITGSRAAPRLELKADGERLRWQENHADTLHIDAGVDLSGETVSAVLAELSGFRTAAGLDSSLRLEAGGVPEQHHARLNIQRPLLEQSFLLGVQGGLAGQRWDGHVTELVLTDEEQPVWSLRNPAELSAGAAAVLLDEACMDGTFGLLCIGGAWRQAGPWSGRATLSQLDLEPLSRRFSRNLLATGILTGDIRLEAEDERFSALSGHVDLTDGEIRPADEIDKVLLSWVRGRLELGGDVEAGRAALTLQLEGDDHVEGRLAVGWNAPDLPLEGQIEAQLTQLHLLPALVPELAELEGTARLHAAIGGTLGTPSLEARFELQDGSVDMPTLGLQPDDIQLLATLLAGNLSFTATGRSGEGRFASEGQFDLSAEGVDGRATLTGEEVLLANLAEAQVAASPNLELRYSGRDITIDGDVAIPFARITALGGATSITASPDEALVGQDVVEEVAGVRTSSRVRVSVGPDVQIQAAGLRGNLEGSILTVIQPEMLPWGRGELRVMDGTFTAFGQRLEILTGRLIYTGGPLENPGLEIRAVRRIDQVTAGALVRGTLQQPEISVYSDPPMPRAEALSYLTLGRSLSELQSSEQRTVNQAANSLALSGGSLIAQDLGKRLGFDEVALAAGDDGEGASLIISRYLGGGLYVGYGLGLFDTVNTLRLRFQINRRLSLEATSGNEQAADLFHTVERD
jgi:translocation and assembly module TamB